MPEYYSFRCKQCDKLLGKITANAEIVCPRCGGKNEISFDSKVIEYTPKVKQNPVSQTSKQTAEHAAQLKRIERRTSSGVTFR